MLAEATKTASFRARDDANKNPLEQDELVRLLPKLEAAGNPDDRDPNRHLRIERSRIGKVVGHTKTGRSRNVALSRRLRQVLLERRMARGRPRGKAWVVEQSWPKNIRERMERVSKAAKLDRHQLKDYRDTFASVLITHGIVLKWVSLQLGHESIATTERNYARWMLVDGYRNPWQVPEGGVPQDLFAEFDGWRATTVPLVATKE